MGLNRTVPDRWQIVALRRRSLFFDHSHGPVDSGAGSQRYLIGLQVVGRVAVPQDWAGRGCSHLPRRALPTLQAPGDAVASTSLASFLFAVALVRADSSFLLTAVLPVAPTVLAAVHPVGLSDGERAIG